VLNFTSTLGSQALNEISLRRTDGHNSSDGTAAEPMDISGLICLV